MHTGRFLRLATALALLLLPARAFAEELVVSAAVSLTNALGETAKGFEAANPGVRVVFNFAASGTLLAQLAKGAPADVFAAADEESMDAAAAKGLVDPATRAVFASNSLVIAVPSSSSAQKLGAADMASLSVARIAVGDPAFVPAGRYAKHALEAAGVWEAALPKLVMAGNARQALDYVARGEVDAGFVYLSDAKAAGSKVRVAGTAGTGGEVRYPAAVVAATANRKAAARFVEYLKSPEARGVFERHGLGRP